MGLVAGFDGFIDRLIEVVDERRSPTSHTRVRTITAFADRVRAAAGRSANVELVTTEVRPGGNGAILALAAGTLGARCVFIGAVGDGQVDPVFEPLARACERVEAIGEPGRTDALEFEDGKLLLGHPSALDAVTWERAVRAAGGVEELRDLLEHRLLAMGNWTMTAAMTAIWERLAEDVLPGSRCAGVFIDLADPAKRSDGDLGEALEALRAMNASCPVTLGLNLAESERLGRLVGGPDAGRVAEESPEAMASAASGLREATGLAEIALHTRRVAALADAEGGEGLAGPFVREPRVSTGAGDHFNAGVCVGRAYGLSRAGRLAMGVGCSGLFVRTGRSPRAEELARFLGELPAPE